VPRDKEADSEGMLRQYRQKHQLGNCGIM